ncbi:MAG: glycosyltransferase family 4 protein [Flavobacteriales bacterium]
MIGKKGVVAQFGGYHTIIPAFWCKTLGKRFAIVLGGFDAVSFPEIHYGAFQNKWMSRAVKFSYKRADLLLPVHESLMFSDYTYFDAMHKAQGVKAFLPNCETPFQTIYNGYDAEFWREKGEVLPSRFTIITVAAGVSEQRRLDLKGVQDIINCAPLLPDFDFIIVGDENNILKEKLSSVSNIKVLPKSSAEELRNLFASSHAYAQLSWSEGFPNALCEAMLCGCIPIVSNVASMPFIIKGCGVVVFKKEMQEITEKLRSLPNVHSVENRAKARKKIASNFSEEKRGDTLINVVSNLISE